MVADLPFAIIAPPYFPFRCSSASMEWSDLLPELLRMVSSKVPDPADFLRIRAVCKNWCAAVAPSDAPRFFSPWLFRLTSLRDLPRICFFSPAAGAQRSVQVPQLQDMAVAAAAGGYLFAVGSHRFDFQDLALPALLLNPLTGDSVRLPDIPSAGDVAVRTFAADGGSWATAPGPVSMTWMASFGARLFLKDGRWTTAGSMVICYTKFDVIAVCRPGELTWTFLRLPFYVKHVMCAGGTILIGDRERVWLLDGATLEFAGELALPGGAGDKYRFVQVSDDTVCVVVHRKKYSELRLENIRRLENAGGGGQPRWAEVESIGDHTVFFGSGGAVSAAGGGGFQYLEWQDGKEGCFIRKRSLVGDGDDVQACPVETVDAWFLPSLSVSD